MTAPGYMSTDQFSITYLRADGTTIDDAATQIGIMLRGAGRDGVTLRYRCNVCGKWTRDIAAKAPAAELYAHQDAVVEHAQGCGAVAAPPAVTSKRPLAELRAFGLKPFAVWSYELGAYLDIPTTWALYPAAAIQQMARRRDRGCTFTDRHGRKPGRSTRDQRVVWSSGMDTGLLRADAQEDPEACPACGAAAHAGACPVDPPTDVAVEPGTR